MYSHTNWGLTIHGLINMIETCWLFSWLFAELSLWNPCKHAYMYIFVFSSFHPTHKWIFSCSTFGCSVPLHFPSVSICFPAQQSAGHEKVEPSEHHPMLRLLLGLSLAVLVHCPLASSSILCLENWTTKRTTPQLSLWFYRWRAREKRAGTNPKFSISWLSCFKIMITETPITYISPIHSIYML